MSRVKTHSAGTCFIYMTERGSKLSANNFLLLTGLEGDVGRSARAIGAQHFRVVQIPEAIELKVGDNDLQSCASNDIYEAQTTEQLDYLRELPTMDLPEAKPPTLPSGGPALEVCNILIEFVETETRKTMEERLFAAYLQAHIAQEANSRELEGKSFGAEDLLKDEMLLLMLIRNGSERVMAFIENNAFAFESAASSVVRKLKYK